MNELSLHRRIINPETDNTWTFELEKRYPLSLPGTYRAVAYVDTTGTTGPGRLAEEPVEFVVAP